MIKKLRLKLIAITMALLTAVLAVVMAFFYYSTKISLENSSMADLQAASAELHAPLRPGASMTTTSPCFILELDRNGRFTAIGSDYYDLSDKEELAEILEEAENAGTPSGVLEDRALRFLKLDSLRGVRYAFTDISGDLAMLEKLVMTCIIVGLAGVLGFLGISVLLARWVTRPVEQAWQQQRQFVADASHELKTPLTVILTNGELLKTGDYDQQTKDRFADSILTMSRQMRGLVEELLELARVDNGTAQLEFAPLDMSKLVHDAVLPFEPVYFEEGRELQSDIEPGILLVGSGAKLRQVVEILLDNGCKYSSPGGTVRLWLRRQGKHCLLTVQSPGKELTEEQCADIFKRFYRADEARTMNHSYGLGLSIAKGIAELHRGKIWAESGEGKNTFFLRLPL